MLEMKGSKALQSCQKSIKGQHNGYSLYTRVNQKQTESSPVTIVVNSLLFNRIEYPVLALDFGVTFNAAFNLS